MPNRPVIREWVEALESGEYEQTTGQLTRIDNGQKSHCCLGVLCEIASKREICQASEGNEFISYDGQIGVLPFSVGHWVGLAESPVAEEVFDEDATGYKIVTYAHLNDNGWDFHRIAAKLRKDYLNED